MYHRKAENKYALPDGTRGELIEPDRVMEVVSTGSVRMNYNKKLFKYRSAGVREYWIIDLQKEPVRKRQVDETGGGVTVCFESKWFCLPVGFV